MPEPDPRSDADTAPPPPDSLAPRALAKAETVALPGSNPEPRPLASSLVTAEHVPLAPTHLEPPPTPAPAPMLLALSALREHEVERSTGRYEKLEKLGQGGMAVVWRARDRKLGREVAWKELREELELQPDGVARFRREAEAIARLSHPHIVAFFDVVEEGSRLALVMELVRGGSFAQTLSRTKPGARDVRALVGVVEKIARGVQHAHEQGVLHRDLKPSNVLVTEGGEPKVGDFGLAQLAGSATLTRTGELLGTPAYMAPEQARGGDVDARTDIHALGAILYEVLAGRPPFAGDSMAALLQKVQNEDPSPLRKLDARIHVDLETITLRCLQKDPARRYRTAGEVADELARFLRGESIHARPPGALERASVSLRRHRLGLVAGLALLLGTLALGSSWLARLQDSWRRRSVVEQAIARALDPAAALDEPAIESAVDRIVTAGDPGAVALLGSALDAVTGHLARATRAAYVAVKTPSEDEARAGAPVLEGLEAALDRRDAGAAPQDEDGRVLLAALHRIEARWEREHVRITDPATSHADWTLAAIQDKAVGPGERRLARIACESLARLGQREAVPCLARYLAVVESDQAATVAGEALARLGGSDAEAAAVAARPRFGSTSAYWLRVRPLLSPDSRQLGDRPPGSAAALRERGVLRAEKRDFVGAIADLTSAIALDPRDPLAWYNRGTARYESGDLRGAIVDLSKAIELAPDDTGFLVNRALVRRERGELDEAMEDLDKALELEPGNKKALLGRGNAKRAQGDLKGAIADISSAIAAAPNFIAAWVARGLAKRQAKDVAGAIADFDEALRLDPKAVAAFTNRGHCYHDKGDEEHALADLTAAIELQPTGFEQRHGRGVVYLKLGRLDAAIEDFARAIELRPRSPAGYQGRGHAYADRGDHALAVADFEKVVELSPTAAAWNDVGLARLMAGDAAQAKKDLDEAIRLAPKLARAYLNRGQARKQTGDVAGALEDFDKMATLEPRSVAPRLERARIRLARGELDQAAPDLEKAASLQPHDVTVWQLLEKLHVARHERAEAVECCTRVIDLDPRNAVAWAERGALEVELGQVDAGLLDLDHGIELDPRMAGAFGARGMARLARGDRAGARADLTRYLELEPDGSDAAPVKKALADLDAPAPR